MENKIGLFGQIKFIFKGIIKPKYFNRLATQSKGKLVAHVLFVSLIVTIVYWGIQILLMNLPNGAINQADITLANVPQIEYANHTLSSEEWYHKYNISMSRHFIIDTTVDKADSKYIEDAAIKTDWTNGKIILIFNSESMSIIMPLGQHVVVDYDTLESVVFLPSVINNSNLVHEYINTIYKLTGAVAIVSYLFFVLTYIVSGMMVALLGLAMVKIIKLQYSFKELVNIGMFIAGFTGFSKVLLNAQPLPINILWINLIFVLISGAYMFFALTGSQEDLGPSSTIVFDKPRSGKFSGEIEPEDPFARKDRRREERFNKEIPAKQEPVYSEPAPVYEEPVQSVVYEEPAPVYEEPVQSVVYEEPAPVYEEPVQSVVYEEPAPVYEEPVQNVVYEEPTPVYTEPTVIKEEPAVARTTSTATSTSSLIVKSDLTYGVGYSSSGSGKKSKPKYDRPITAPDSYNGAYYGGGDEEGYANTYGSGTLLDRGGLYGKTLGAPAGSVGSNPFGDVINASAARNSTSSGDALYGNNVAGTSSMDSATSSGGVTFTTKTGNQPFVGATNIQTHTPGKTINHYDKSGVSSKPYTKKGSSKPISRYTADDFAAWEKENYAEEFNKPRGGFGNNIF